MFVLFLELEWVGVLSDCVCGKGEKREGDGDSSLEKRGIFTKAEGHISRPGAKQAPTFVDSNNGGHLSGANYLENVEWNGMGANMMMMDLSLRCADTLLHTYITMSGFFLPISFSFLSWLQVRSRNMGVEGSLNLGFFFLWLRAVVCGGNTKGTMARSAWKGERYRQCLFLFPNGTSHAFAGRRIAIERELSRFEGGMGSFCVCV